MPKKPKPKVLNWEEFQSLGNPEFSNPLPAKNKDQPSSDRLQQKIRIHLERKGRRGKTVTIVRGLEVSPDQLKKIGRSLKQNCGVGGSTEGQSIILQGDQRNRVMKLLKEEGFQDIKLAGH